MKEYVYDFEEFVRKINSAFTPHHTLRYRCIDKHGLVYRCAFTITAPAAEHGHIVVFKLEKDLSKTSKEVCEKGGLSQAVQSLYDELVEKYGKPVGSTEGYWQP